MKKVVFYLMAAAVVFTAACNKEDDKAVSVTGVKLDRETLGLVLNDTEYGHATLTATVEPTNAENKKVSWAVSAGNSVSVSDGVVTALRVGTSTVTVTTDDGGFKAHCEVEVTETIIDVVSVTIEVEGGGEFEVEEDAKLQLKAVYLPSNATRPSISWGSSNSGIASVNVSTGEVTGVAKSDAPVTITVSVSTPGGGQASGDCQVTVLPPGILNQVADEDIWYMNAKLTWKNGFDVDSIAIKEADGGELVKGVKLGEDAIENLELVVSGLEPEKYYRATIYFEDDAFNTVTFKTTVIPDDEIDVPAWVAGSDVRRIFNDFAHDGQTINLEGDEYTMAGLRLTKSITINGASGRTEITFTGGGKIFAGNEKIDKIHFEGIDFNGDGGNQDLFNVDAASADNPDPIDVGIISFKNCTFSGYTRTPILRVSNDGNSIDEVVVDNCIVKNCAGLLFNSTNNTPIGKLVLKNSTFAALGVGIIRWDSCTDNMEVTVESCTFYDLGEAQPIFRLNNTPADVDFSKCLFSKTKPVLVQGIRTAGTVTSADSYYTNDFVLDSRPIDDLIPYEGDAAALFTNPAAFDFSIKDAAFAGKGTTGDPRWY